MKNKVTIFLTVLIITSVLYLNMETQQNEVSPSLLPTFSLTGQSEIEILSDDDFTTENGVVSGNGSTEAPYIIEGWNISLSFESTNHAIDIRDTTAHFIVRNNWITTGGNSGPSGIYISNVVSETAIIENNTVVNCGVGIAIINADNTLVANNSVINNLNYGIQISSSDYVEVFNNTCYGNYYGIWTSVSLDATIFENSLEENNNYGLYTDNISHYMNITNNYVVGNKYGLRASGMCAIFHNNTVNDNLETGIYCGSINVTVSYNKVENNAEGIWVKRNNATIINNVVLNNNLHGILRDGGIDVLIANNTLVKGGYSISKPSGNEAYQLSDEIVDDFISKTIVKNNTINGLPLGWFVNQQDVTISGSEEYGQLYFINSSNVIIENINYSEMNYGVFIFNSKNILIRDSVFEKMGTPIRLDGIDNCEIINNEITNTTANAIAIRLTDKLVIEGNEISEVNNYAVYLYSCNNSVIENNFVMDIDNVFDVEGNSYDISILNNIVVDIHDGGIELYSVENCIVSNNVLISGDESDYGICTDDCYYLTIEENYLEGFELGMELGEGNYGLIVNNIIIDSLSYGLTISGNNVTFYHNLLIDNNVGVQAEDDGINNTWYDSIALEGNYWFDWNGTGNYSIDGSANTFDLYPLTFDLSLEHYVTVNVEFGTSDNEIEWTVTSSLPVSEQTPIEYIIYKNGSETSSGIIGDTYDIIYTVEGAETGLFNYTILITDYLNNTVIDTAFINVQDTTNPLIDSPTDFTFEEGETGNSVSWTATDLDPSTFIVYTNDVETTPTEWVSGTPIEFNVDDLTAGTYNFTIVVFDGSGNSVSDTVIVTVTEPTTTSPSTTTILSTSSSTTTQPGSSPGFLFLITILTFIILGSIYIKKNRRR